jgi:hypothetical protein
MNAVPAWQFKQAALEFLAGSLRPTDDVSPRRR